MFGSSSDMFWRRLLSMVVRRTSQYSSSRIRNYIQCLRNMHLRLHVSPWKTWFTQIKSVHHASSLFSHQEASFVLEPIGTMFRPKTLWPMHWLGYDGYYSILQNYVVPQKKHARCPIHVRREDRLFYLPVQRVGVVDKDMLRPSPDSDVDDSVGRDPPCRLREEVFLTDSWTCMT